MRVPTLQDLTTTPVDIETFIKDPEYLGVRPRTFPKRIWTSAGLFLYGLIALRVMAEKPMQDYMRNLIHYRGRTSSPTKSTILS